MADISIPDNSGLNSAAAQLSSTIRNDLDLSGVFTILNPKSFLVNANKEGFTVKDIQFENWRNVGADALVKTKMSRQEDILIVEAYIFDVATQKSRWKRNYKAPSNMRRQLAHRISDDVYRAFTGEGGVMGQPLIAIKRIGQTKHVVRLDADGKNVTQMSKGGRLNLLPSFSPDATKIYYTSYRYDNPDLFVMDAASRKYQRISKRPGLNTGGVLSPDGSRLAVTLSINDNTDIYLMDPDGKNPKRLTKAWGIDTSPSWSPDGQKCLCLKSLW